MVMPLLATDEQSASRLRRMKVLTTGLLVVAAGVYAGSFELSGDLAGYVRAGSEAALVGGLADWFAVTALFRRPFGLPIPHTGLVPRQKDEIAGKLGEFVTGHFLTRAAVVAELHERQVLQRAATWLRRPDVADRIAGELAKNADAVLGALDEEALVASVLELIRRDQARRPWAPLLGRALDRAVDGGTQRPLVDVLVSRSRSYLQQHRDELLPQARSFVDDRGWLASMVVSDRRIRGVIDGFADLLGEVERTPGHRVRRWLEDLLRSVARDLREDQRTAEKLDAVVVQLLDDPKAQAVLHDVVTDVLTSLRESLADVDGELQHRISGLLVALADRVLEDDAFRGRIERVAENVVGHAVENYGDELTGLIKKQVAAWDATSASRNIELAVGRDLQFIRINGTAVGALAGLAIHALTQLTT